MATDHQTLSVPPEQLNRAFHNTNLLMGMALPHEALITLIQGLYIHAALLPPSATLVARMIAHGHLWGSFEELRAVEGLEGDDALQAAALALGHPSLGEAMSELLQDITGVAAAIPELPPLPEATPADAALADPGDGIDLSAVRWDVIFCAYDVATRRHRLTLLRAGKSVEGPVLTAEDERGPGDPAAEWLFEDALSAPLLSSATEHLLGYARAFQTPAVPDRDALVAQLQADHGPFQQLYLLEVVHALPAPSRVTQEFWLREAGERGREQRLTRDLRAEAVGLGLEDAEAVLHAQWDTPSRLRVSGTDRPFQPLLLTSADIDALQMGGGWQARLSWSLVLRPLLPDGPRLPVAAELDLQGRVAVAGRGRFQEHVAATSGMFAAIYSGDDGRCLRSTGMRDAAPRTGIDWPVGASSGVGQLSVHAGTTDRDLSGAGVEVAAELRPPPGLPPNIAEEHVWADATPMLPLEDTLDLSGGVVIEQTVRLEDSLRAAQASARVQGAARLETPLWATVGGHLLRVDLFASAGVPITTPLPDYDLDPAGVAVQALLREQPWGGTISVDGVPRWRLCWRSRVEQAAVTWSEEIELVSGGNESWGGAVETSRDRVAAHHAVTVERAASGYVLVPLEPGEGVAPAAAGSATAEE